MSINYGEVRMLVIKCQIHYDIYKIKKLSGKSLGFYFNVGSIPTLATKCWKWCNWLAHVVYLFQIETYNTTNNDEFWFP